MSAQTAGDGPPSEPATGTPAAGGGQPAGRLPGVRGPATSALSVAQAAALRRLGLVPAGFVMGTAVMQVVSGVGGAGALGGGGYGGGLRGGTQFPCAHMMGFGTEHWGYNAEDLAYASSVSQGYDLALQRLREEASQAGAHGVVGVELTVGDLVGGYSTWTFRATGTAVTLPRAPLPKAPFVTNATGQHVERLMALGLAPAALVTGVGACYVQPNCRTRGDPTVPGPVEQAPHALGVARGRARGVLHDAARRHGGDGVVHTWFGDRRIPGWGEGWIQTAVATGTVVRRFTTARVPAAPQPVVPLRP